MDKVRVLSFFISLVMLLGCTSLANNNELKTFENQEVVPIEKVEEYKNSINEEIEFEGIRYKLNDIEQNENKKNTTKEKELTQTIIVTNNNKNAILKLFENKKSINEDGYVGTLELQRDSLQIRENESYTEEYKETIKRTYNNVSQNELNDIPKQIVENGVTYYLVKPIWNIATTEKIGNNEVPVSYNGIMNYETVKKRTVVKSYKATVNYKGVLQKDVIDSIIITTKYEEIPKEEIKEEIPTKNDYTTPIIAGTTTSIIIYSGIIILKRKNVKVFNYDEDGNCKIIKRTRLNNKELVVDITPLRLGTNKYKIELSTQIFNEIKGKNITIKYFDKQFIVEVKDRIFDISV